VDYPWNALIMWELLGNCGMGLSTARILLYIGSERQREATWREPGGGEESR